VIDERKVDEILNLQEQRSEFYHQAHDHHFFCFFFRDSSRAETCHFHLQFIGFDAIESVDGRISSRIRTSPNRDRHVTEFMGQHSAFKQVFKSLFMHFIPSNGLSCISDEFLLPCRIFL
jgi:hypothetical protein